MSRERWPARWAPGCRAARACPSPRSRASPVRRRAAGGRQRRRAGSCSCCAAERCQAQGAPGRTSVRPTHQFNRAFVSALSAPFANRVAEGEGGAAARAPAGPGRRPAAQPRGARRGGGAGRSAGQAGPGGLRQGGRWVDHEGAREPCMPPPALGSSACRKMGRQGAGGLRWPLIKPSLSLPPSAARLDGLLALTSAAYVASADLKADEALAADKVRGWVGMCHLAGVWLIGRKCPFSE